MKIRLGVAGLGDFSKQFLELFTTHPDIEKVVGAEFIEERRIDAKENYGIETV